MIGTSVKNISSLVISQKPPHNPHKTVGDQSLAQKIKIAYFQDVHVCSSIEKRSKCLFHQE